MNFDRAYQYDSNISKLRIPNDTKQLLVTISSYNKYFSVLLVLIFYSFHSSLKPSLL